jgi:radical SAM superfamily enzyme YgiQ (UPF0313 family)/MoaA/NifB/PqqE/SkfB family radical SAM enzyme
MALAQLSGCLKKAGYAVSCFDLNIRLYLGRTSDYRDSWAWEQCFMWYKEEAVDRILKDNNDIIRKCVDEIISGRPSIVGFSVSAASRIASLKIAGMIKNIKKDIFIVFGGPLFFEKKFVEEILRSDDVDIVIQGEGEAAFTELAGFIKKGQDLSGCAGIAYKTKAGIARTGAREYIKDLDSLPFMDFTDLPLSRYDDSRHIVFMASRGCVQKCAFCSSRAFWPKYRAMSGKRIFDEIKYHKKREGRTNPRLGHVDFIDLMLNGNMKYLVEFCDLMIKDPLDIKWSANMIIRPEMTKEVIDKMKASGCEHIIFGIESGSQKVLDLMTKHYRVQDADRVIKDMHNAGIRVTANFMFGFPGETEGDFRETLDFIRRNYGFLDRAYPSRTYCAIEEFSYLADHQEEFGIKPNPPNHLFWESADGKNTYPERMRRCREFSQLASSLKIDVGCGVQTSVDMDEYFNLYLYYEHKKDMRSSLGCLLKYFELNSLNGHVRDRLEFYLTKSKEGDPLFCFDDGLSEELKKAVSLIKKQKKEQTARQCDVQDNSGRRTLSVSENSGLNDIEFNSGKIILDSAPKQFFIEANGNSLYDFIFDKRNRDCDIFSLKTFCSRFERRLMPVMSMAEEVLFFGDGDFLMLEGIDGILEYFDKNLPGQTKIFSTKGAAFSPALCEKLASLKSRFVANIELPAFSRERYNVMTRYDNMADILRNLEYLLKSNPDPEKLKVNILFTATALNIEEMPDVARLAADMAGINKFICRYSQVYEEKQTYLSCYFRQSAANKARNQALESAKKLDLKIDNLPYFGDNGTGAEPGLCRAPWSGIVLDTLGRVIVCPKSNRYIDALDAKDFFEVWNNGAYKTIRKNFIEKNCPYFNRCVRANIRAVDNFNAHKAYYTDEREVF